MLRIPKALAAQVGLRQHSAVEMSVQGSQLVITPAAPRYELSTLLAQITPDNLHRETTWSAAQGQEEW